MQETRTHPGSLTGIRSRAALWRGKFTRAARHNGFHSPLLCAAVILKQVRAAEVRGAACEVHLKSSTSVVQPAETSPLNARLSAYRAQSGKLKPDFAKAYDELVDRLAALDRGEVGPKTGEPMPPFDLPDEAGRLVSLTALLQSGPVVISINRGHWCPYCKMELRSLAAIHGEIRRLGAHVVSIMPDTAQFTGDYAAENELPFPVLSDIDLGYSLSLGLIFWVGAEIQRLYREAGVELEKYHGNQGSFLPMAAKFIVGRDGLVKARQVNIEFRERMEPDAIIAALEALPA